MISASISRSASGQCFAATVISSRQSVSLQSISYRPPGGSPGLLITGAPARTSWTRDPGWVLSSKQARDSTFKRIVMIPLSFIDAGRDQTENFRNAGKTNDNKKFGLFWG